jgi:NAD(P)-dependent dehydrogenase (short-subunit alcohol dehydrogenase family)
MKSAFITGANKGLGYGFVEYLLGQGVLVFAGTRKLHDDLPKHENLVWVECDVTDDISIDKAVEEISKKVKSVTFLVNNAGVNKDTIPGGDKDMVSKLGFLDRDALMGMFNINTISPLMVTQKFLPLLTSDPSFVINISSSRASFAQGHAGSTANYGYASSKVALNMMTFCSEAELPANVKTFAINPGGVRTDMNPDGPNEPIKKAEKIIGITEHWKDEFNGRFIHHDGTIHEL